MNNTLQIKMGCNICNQKKYKFTQIQSSPSLTSSKILQIKPIKRSSTRKQNNHKNALPEDLQADFTETQELNNAVKLSQTKSSIQKSVIKLILLKHFLFNFLGKKDLKKLIEGFSLYQFDANIFIFTQGSIGQYFYIIEEGTAEIIINSEVKSTISKGACFGDLALIHNTTRTASVRTKVPTNVWALKSTYFKRALSSINQFRYFDNKSFLETVPFFRILSLRQKMQILNFIICQDFKIGEKIIAEGDPGDIFYVIKQGTVVCTIGGVEIRTMTQGEFFGEQVFFNNQLRTATVTAASDVNTISLGMRELQEVFGERLQEVIYKNSIIIAIEKCESLNFMNTEQIEKAVEIVKIQSFNEGQVIFKNGEKLEENFYFIVKGTVKYESGTFNVFDTIDSSYFTEPREDFRAVNSVDIAMLSKIELEFLFQSDLQNLMQKNALISVLKQIYILRSLSLKKLETLISVLKVEEYPENSIIFKQGDLCDSFFIIQEGKVEILRDGIFLRSLSNNNFFGERSILFDEPRSATVISLTNCKLWVLKKAEFLRIIDQTLQKSLVKRILLQNDQITLNDLNFVRFIGEGTFGKVLLVKYQKGEAFYALKTVERWKISEFNIFDNLLNERSILLQLDHPMLMKLVKTFKDENRLYFLCEYVEGVDLFEVLRCLESIDENISMFYIGCLMLIIKYLHNKSIVYRDLKPENIMIDEDGYPKLIDFGTAKVLNNRTFTILGTPHYMAPEMIKGCGYGLEVDLWSIGVILYEFLFFNLPFGDDEVDMYKIYRLILESEPAYPSKSLSCSNFIEVCLNKSPSVRGTVETLIQNSWFTNFRWEKLISKQLRAPYIPQQKTQTPQEENKNYELLQIIAKFESKPSKPDLFIQRIPPQWDKDF